MKNSLWIIIALVTGVVGFLVGYSVSGFTAARRATEVAGHAAPAQGGAAGGYGGAGAPAHKAEAGGYGAAAAPPAKAEAGGYGAVQPVAHPEKVPADKPKAAGY